MSRRFQFSLRALLVVLTLGCISLGGYADGVRRQREALALVESLGSLAYHGYEWDDGRDWFRTGLLHEPGPAWLRQIVGIEWLDPVVAIRFAGAPVSDADLIRLIEGLPELRYLELSHTAIGDRGVSNIDRLRQLRKLEMANTQIGDRALEAIGRVRLLRSLDLCDTRVTDNGLPLLYGLADLRSIYLESTAVTLDGMAKLRKALPRAKKRRY
jgi:hypothetical protein